MKRLTTAAIGATCFMLGAGGATLYAADWSPVYVVFEANVPDEVACNAALPEVQQIIKDNGGNRIAGGFNKTKTLTGAAAANRYVIVRYNSQEAFDKAYVAGVKAWIERNAPTARQVRVQQ